MSLVAMRHLAQDPAFAGLIAVVGRPRLVVERDRSPYEALVRAIAHQQLHGNAARAILGRFEALYPGLSFPTPEMVLATEESVLRGCGFSLGKIAAIRDICARAIDGTVPTRRAAARLSDAALIERLVPIPRGRALDGRDDADVGPWAGPTSSRSTISACARAIACCTGCRRSRSHARWPSSACRGRPGAAPPPGTSGAPPTWRGRLRSHRVGPNPRGAGRSCARSRPGGTARGRAAPGCP